MNASERPWRRFVEGPGSIGAWARGRRWSLFAAHFPDISSWTVLDLGGTPAFWAQAPIRPARVITVNPERHEVTPELSRQVMHRIGDACTLDPSDLDDPIDLVFSNSVIEHLSGSERRHAFAEVARSAAQRRWIQTPNRWFPIEPHLVAPGQQFLPLAGRAWTHRHWPLVHTTSTSRAESIEAALSTELLSRTELAHYFPGDQIIAERVAGLAKSLVAVSHPSSVSLGG